MASPPSIIIIDDYGEKFNNGYVWKGIKKVVMKLNSNLK